MMMMQRHRQMMLLSGISAATIFAMMQTYWPMRMTRRH
jgi:predicted DNA-binding transcriptional regulator AlpA